MKEDLYLKGIKLIRAFCEVNDLPIPKVTNYDKEDWFVLPCAYYRPSVGICICVEECAYSCTEVYYRKNWNWPGSTVDRTPYGVLAHELGHHADVQIGYKLGLKCGPYFSEFSKQARKKTKEKPLTGYCPDDAEWFAEMFRLFVTNPNLLSMIRPKTYKLFKEHFDPVVHSIWTKVLGDCPERVLRACMNKIGKKA